MPANQTTLVFLLDFDKPPTLFFFIYPRDRGRIFHFVPLHFVTVAGVDTNALVSRDCCYKVLLVICDYVVYNSQGGLESPKSVNEDVVL